METAVCTKTEIIARLHQAEPQLRALGVRRLALFGSFVRGDLGPQCDVDLLVEFEPGQKSFDYYMDLCDLLELVLQRSVDVVTTEALSLFISPPILDEAEDVLQAA